VLVEAALLYSRLKVVRYNMVDAKYESNDIKSLYTKNGQSDKKIEKFIIFDYNN